MNEFACLALTHPVVSCSYLREESFLVVNVSVNHANLTESLEEYVKKELLDGDNKYLCEQCNKRVRIEKRSCIKSLPQFLTIQLKRFEYDWNR